MRAIPIHCVSVPHLFPLSVSPVRRGGNTSSPRYTSAPTFTHLSFPPNKPNQQKKLFFLIKHPHFSWEGAKQTINLSLFVLGSPASLNTGYPGTCGSQSAAIRPEEKMNGLRAEGLIFRELVPGGQGYTRKIPCCQNAVQNYDPASA